MSVLPSGLTLSVRSLSQMSVLPLVYEACLRCLSYPHRTEPVSDACRTLNVRNLSQMSVLPSSYRACLRRLSYPQCTEPVSDICLILIALRLTQMYVLVRSLSQMSALTLSVRSLSQMSVLSSMYGACVSCLAFGHWFSSSIDWCKFTCLSQ